MKVDGLTSLQQKLTALKAQANDPDAEVVVGFSQKYAVDVHENLEARHAAGKQAKYLEAPARRLHLELAKIVRDVFKRTGSWSKGLLMAGLRLLREAQQVVPIDTSALKASGYVAFKKDEASASSAAFSKSEGIRQGESKSRVKKSVEARDKALLKRRLGKFRKAERKEAKRKK